PDAYGSFNEIGRGHPQVDGLVGCFRRDPTASPNELGGAMAGDYAGTGWHGVEICLCTGADNRDGGVAAHAACLVRWSADEPAVHPDGSGRGGLGAEIRHGRKGCFVPLLV